MRRRSFVLATALGQAASALVSGPLSILASGLAGDTTDPGERSPSALVVVMVSVGLIEGAFTGAAQAIALRPHVDSVRLVPSFVARSAASFGIAWALGLASSFGEASFAPAIDPGVLALLVAAMHGSVLGVLVGATEGPLLFEARAERRRFTIACATGWSAALVVATILADRLASESPAREVLLGVVRGAIVGACSGLVVGDALRAGLGSRTSRVGSATTT